jgi:uncharacterized protein (TIGR03086 family)
MEPTKLLHRALEHATGIVERIKPNQMKLGTPCPDFDVATLLNHTTASVQGFADAASGKGLDMGLYQQDLLGNDPEGSFAKAAAELRGATADPAVVKQKWGLPFGDTPGDRAIAIAIIEVAQHGWDLARATKQESTLDDDTAEGVLAIAKENFPPDDERPPEMFGPPVTVSDDAPAPDRLAAFLGRKP